MPMRRSRFVPFTLCPKVTSAMIFVVVHWCRSGFGKSLLRLMNCVFVLFVNFSTVMLRTKSREVGQYIIATFFFHVGHYGKEYECEK